LINEMKYPVYAYGWLVSDVTQRKL